MPAFIGLLEEIMSDKVRVIHARRFNIVHLVFLVLLVYMVIILGNYISKEDVKVTEVTRGSLSQNHTYSGLILRDEEVIKSKSVGYVKCFVTDGSRVSKDGILFAVDKKQPQSSSSQNSSTKLTDNDYKTIRKYLDNFSTKYDGMQFDDVYAFKGQLTNLLYGLEQKGLTISKEDENEKYTRAGQSCVVYFTVDGLEDINPDAVTRDYLEKITYRPVRCSTGNSVEKGQAICKTILSDDWNVLIPINDEDYLYYSGRKSTKIYLPDLNVETFADIRINEDSEQNKVAVLTLHKYMSSYSFTNL